MFPAKLLLVGAFLANKSLWGSGAQKIAHALRPGVLFTMRYPDDEGYVWSTIAQSRDAASKHLCGAANCFIAYPRLTAAPTYRPEFVQPVELNCYDVSQQGLDAAKLFINDNNIKVIVFMSALPSTLKLRYLRSLGVRTINTENDSFDHRQPDRSLKRAAKFFVRRILRQQLHDLHIANADSQKEFLAKSAMIPPAHIAVVKNAVDCARFSPGNRQAAREETGLDVKKFWIICVAQARPEKRIDFLIRVAKSVLDARPNENLGFVYVGDGPPVTRWRNLVAELGLQEMFRFAGRQDDLVPFYRSANLMAHAAERESFGLAIVEAMACGIPVVASAAAGPMETIVSGKTGCLVELKDEAGFVEAILRYIDDPQLLDTHGAQARERSVGFYNVTRQGMELAKEIARFL